ncbi:MAG: Hsp20/alpha crystallin family protein [Tannerella sp.]|jgi:HSP20 family protein|nr:Hsp20/alpha crystallin family protein [Tannerella sp.]
MATLARRDQGWLPLFFNDFFKDDWKVGTSSTVPAINVKESEDAYIVEVAAAGMTKDDFNVRIDDDNDLVITMEKKSESKDENKEARYLRREFSYSKFQQTMILPDNVNKEKIEAKVEHGVLAVNLPKLTENEIQKKQRSISIG